MQVPQRRDRESETRRRKAPCATAAPASGSLLHRRMGLLRAHDQVAASGLPGGDQSSKGRGRGAVLDVPVPARGQPEQLGHPPQNHALELGRGGCGAPQDGDRVQRGRQQLGEDGRLGSAGGEIGEVARVLPVGHARQEYLVQVAEHRGERLALFGGGPGSAAAMSPGATEASTGSSPTRSRYEAAHSSAAAPSRRRSVKRSSRSSAPPSAAAPTPSTPAAGRPARDPPSTRFRR